MIANGYEIKQGADLRGANLYGANLRRANLREANLRRANLRGADLYGADLRGANLYEAELGDANLCEADLREADLREADLCDVDLHGANLSAFQMCPEEGSFIAWKKVDTGVIKLLIPAAAKRTSSLVGRKCRAEYVIVLKGSGKSSRGGLYEQGKEYHADSYNPDIRVECSHGVHFFMTRKEAEKF